MAEYGGTTTTRFNLVDRIVAFEAGELDEDGIVDLFTYLIRTGYVWQLQGFYGRTAMELMRNGYIDPSIVDEPEHIV